MGNERTVNLALAIALFGAAAGSVLGEPLRTTSTGGGLPSQPEGSRPVGIPLVGVAAEFREEVTRICQRPTLHVRGPAEAFRASPILYGWLLDHPDQAVALWRSLGASCTEISVGEGGRFVWNDSQNGMVWWQTVWSGSQGRVWYGQGRARASRLLPALTARAVVMLHVRQAVDALGRPMIRHQAELFLQTDSKTATLIARLLGTSANHVAEEAVGQLEMFFSALAWYLDRHPDRIGAFAADIVPTETVGPVP